MKWSVSTSLAVVMLTTSAAAGADDFPKPYDSQPTKTGPVAPERALAGIKLPEGFRATLLAAEPDVRQPIAMTLDGRGRLWVAENYTYAEVAVGYDDKLRDRILIFEDSDHDGKFDKRTVFWDRGGRLTSVEVGFGGVYAIAPPHLLFIPDRDRDDRPDGPPVVLLDGFVSTRNHHTLANGLKWGPDGWLYGRQGIQDTSHVGAPGTPDAKRVPINGSIWRYHPTRKVFEVVCEGTTNPWGLDWDRHGEGFFINTVIGHLWHIVPGAHYVRMFGQDPGPVWYGLIDQTADHVHWDTRDSWVVTRTAGVTAETDKTGGGHAHTGLMLYQGDNWPESYRNELFTINFHGRRLNRDHVERSGATYVGRHRPDFATWDDPWFRGIDLISGPDGGVIVSDWSDTGECHENDGVHRSSGRLFKIVHGSPKPPAIKDVAALSEAGLVSLQTHMNVWYARQAQRVLQERAAAGGKLTEAREALERLFASSPDVVHRLRALWCLHSIEALDEKAVISLLDEKDEHIRAWGVRLLVDHGAPSAKGTAALLSLAGRETSGLTLTYLASSLRRLSAENRWSLASRLAKRSEFADDRVLPLMVWYGLESVVTADPDRAAELASGPAFGPLRRHLARRLAQETGKPAALGPILAAAAASKDVALKREVLSGIADAHVQDRSAPKPPGWSEVVASAVEPDLRPLVRELSVLFGDTSALAELKRIAADVKGTPEERRDALKGVVRFRPDGAVATLTALLADTVLSAEAARGLATFPGVDQAGLLLREYPRLSIEARVEALAALASRPTSTEALLREVKSGRVPAKDVPAFVVGQMRNHAKAPIPTLLGELWPVSVRAKARIETMKRTLEDGRLPKASLERGRVVFEKTCAQCHKLFGEGGSVGPELTGAQRGDLGYLLENILDPNATLAPDYRMSVFALADGRTINGLAVERTPNAVTIQTPTEKIVVRPSEIEGERRSEVSLMPDGLLDPLTEQQVADLVRYLQSPRKAP